LTGTDRRVRVVLIGFNANAIADGVVGEITFTIAGSAGNTATLGMTGVTATTPQATTITPAGGVAGAVIID
jgi:hypothetical protein